MPEFGPPFKKKDFFFNDRDKRLFLIALRVAGGLAVLCLAALIAAAVTPRPQTASHAPVAAAPGGTGEPESAGPSLTAGGELSLPMSLSSFVLPDDLETGLEPEYEIFLPRTGKWDRKTIERYWVPPAGIGLEKLRKVNDKNIENMFDGVQ